MGEALEDEDEEIAVADIPCASCGCDVHLTSEIFLARVVSPHMQEGKLIHTDLLTASGNYAHSPLFFDFDCWEELAEALAERCEDVPPISDENGLLLCDYCESDILPNEAVVLVHFGELHWSSRRPNCADTKTFAVLDDGKHLCTACLHLLNEIADTPLWEDVTPIPDRPTCADGLFSRCWRYGDCDCEKGTRT